ncbi:fungal hydrophobin [Ganoderma leucocontextum]|nr:fungal hydrophobin [Ganoderma leucocontextum]
MFARVAAVAALFSLPILAVASGSCNTGDIQCCNSFEESDSAAGAGILSAIGVNVQDVTGLIGLQCSPLTVIGAGVGSSCSQAPVCCQNNNVGGLVSIGCVPVQL